MSDKSGNETLRVCRNSGVLLEICFNRSLEFYILNIVYKIIEMSDNYLLGEVEFILKN